MCDATPCTRADGSNACAITAAPMDGGVADAGAPMDAGRDAGRDAGARDVVTPDLGAPGPMSGTLVITEIMNDPDAVTDALGEWFEVYNPSETPVDLRGMRVRGSGAEMFTIMGASPLMVPGRGYAVLAKSADMAANGGVAVLYAYGSAMDLGNGSATPDSITLIASDGTTVIDSVTYQNSVAAGWPVAAGRSKALRPTVLDATMNDLPASWCAGGPTFGRGDHGTPGAANVCM